jgi:alkyldihydroxyacetonephosphate synthase
LHVGRIFGSQWHKSRFRTPYLRNTLWEMGYAVDTLETATDWTNTPVLLAAIEAALRGAAATFSERIHVFTHLSHVYPQGTSIYTTYVWRVASDPDEALHRWQALKTAASQAVIRGGGTISHQHGVGRDHLPYLLAEKGELGIAALKHALRLFDPTAMMNPGKLVE